MQELNEKTKKSDRHLLIKTLNIRIYKTTYNQYRAELKRKGGETFVGYGGYPTEALESLLFCMTFRRDWMFINEALIHDEWE